MTCRSRPSTWWGRSTRRWPPPRVRRPPQTRRSQRRRSRSRRKPRQSAARKPRRTAARRPRRIHPPSARETLAENKLHVDIVTVEGRRFKGDADFVVAPGSEGELRSEERRVGKECRSRWSPYH